MKKISLFLIALLFASIPSFADTRASILLLHNGQGKSFDAAQLQQAVNEAISGDTICLSVGTFPISDTLLIDKAVTIIGNGETTKVQGCIKIGIPDGPTLSNSLLSSIRVTGCVFVSKELHGLKLKKCWLDRHFYATGTLTDLFIDRCYMMCFVPTSYIKSALISNSILYCVGDEAKEQSKQNPWSIGNELTFFNCSIGYVKVVNASSGTQKICDVTFVNSIICSYGSGNSNISNNTLINTLLNYSYLDSSDTMANCYKQTLSVNPAYTNGWFPTFRMNGKDITDEALLEAGYIGNDGTVVGANGGNTPYTLQADGVRITESVLKVDPVTRQLNVTLKVE